MKEVPCDICQSNEAIEVPFSRQYTDDQPIHICKNCGFVHVKFRRSSEEIANDWSDEVYGDDFTESQYTARIPAVKARQTYVADFLDVEAGLKGKTLCDIGAGEGQFLEIVQGNDYQAKVFGVEPSAKNCELLTKSGFENFRGTAEDFRASEMFQEKQGTFDFVTMMWTLCNSYSCREMFDVAYKTLKVGGHFCVAEGSRILVPFKKPLHYYFSKIKQDLHPFHFSANALKNLFRISGFEVVAVNRYIDTDILCVIGKKLDSKKDVELEKDDYREVEDFFKRWHKETENFYQTT